MLIFVNKTLDLILAHKASIIHPIRSWTCNKHEITFAAPLCAHAACALTMAAGNDDSSTHLPQGETAQPDG